GFFPTGGISAHYAHAFLALGCRQVGELELDPAERLIVKDFERPVIEERLRDGLFADAFTALTLFYGLASLDAARS
ncbi:MAG: hypothetical protein AAFZ65_11250, partial [Planctomycetota bacterium]